MAIDFMSLLSGLGTNPVGPIAGSTAEGVSNAIASSGGVTGTPTMGGSVASLANAESLAGVNPSATGLRVGPQSSASALWDNVKNFMSEKPADSMFSNNNMQQLLGGLGKAFSARDKDSWQYQLGGLAEDMGKHGNVAGFFNALAGPPKQTPQGGVAPAASAPQAPPAQGLGTLGTLGPLSSAGLNAPQSPDASQLVYQILSGK